MEIAGKNIIITGASAGIGREVLNLVIQYERVKIIAVARHIESITPQQNLFPFAADVSNKEDIDKVFTFAKETFGETDIFIANAGFAYLERLLTPDWTHISQIYDLNVFSPIYSLEKLAIESQREKAFVCIVSGVGFVSLPGYSLYCSTKAALSHFIDTYRYEKRDNLQITAVYPVATRTSFFDKAIKGDNAPLPFPQQDTTTVARKIIRGIERRKKKVFPSLLFRLFLPLSRVFPFLLKIYSKREKKKVSNWL